MPVDKPHQTKQLAFSKAFPCALAAATSLVPSALALAQFLACDQTARYAFLTVGVASGLIILKLGVDTVRLLLISMGSVFSRPSGQEPVKGGAQLVVLYVIGLILLALHFANANYADEACRVGLPGILS